MPRGIEVEQLNSAGQPTGAKLYFTEPVAGSGEFSQQLTAKPATTTPGRFARNTKRPYAPEGKRVFNPSQFLRAGEDNLYFSPNFRFCLDWAGYLSFAERRKYGINCFSQYGIAEADRGGVAAGEGMLYVGEGGPLGTLEGFGVYNSSLAAYYSTIWERTPGVGVGNLAGWKQVILNIEVSLNMLPGNVGSTYAGFSQGGSFNQPFFPEWSTVKGNTILCEYDGVSRSWEALANLGQTAWNNEISTRRANRFILLMQVIRRKSAAGTLVSFGYAMHNGAPRVDFATNTGTYVDGLAKVTSIGGDAQGNIAFDGQNYRLSGQIFDNEDFMDGYWYLFDADLSAQDYADIFTNKVAGTQTYPYFWSKIRPQHIVAIEKGFIQENRRKMIARQGATRPFWRQVEPMYEGNTRIPFAELQNTINGTGVATPDTPKPWQSPADQYSRVAVTRFFAGDEPGWGFYCFPRSPEDVGQPLSALAFLNHELHPYTAMIQARILMQPLEAFFPGSTLVENPEVQENQTGAWVAYNGVTANNYDNGVQGTQHPAGLLRWKATSFGWTVWLLAGMNQGYATERTDLWRVPGGGLNGNMFRLKLIGPEAQWHEFAVSAGDSGQIYDALPTTDAVRRAGYAGRITV